MEWLIISLKWYLILFFLGIIFFPLTKKIFNKFLDFGYPFAKILGIVLLSYTVFLLGTIKILPFSLTTLIFLLIIFFIFNLFLIKISNKKSTLHSSSNFSIFLIIFEEVLFFASFLFWTYIRGQEPSIRSLEKFMDFGFINSILRSQYFPPLDMWLSADHNNPAGYPINYYYFGHLSGAVLIKLINIKSAIGYNLLLSTIFALAISQVFSLVINIINKFQPLPLSKLIVFGLFGAFITNLGGNLHTIYVFTSGYPKEQPIPFWQILTGFNPEKYQYPNATRFIPLTIHEFPSYSYVVADLHGHVFDIPFVLLTLTVLFLFFLNYFKEKRNSRLRKGHYPVAAKKIINFSISHFFNFSKLLIINNPYLITSIFLGFLIAVHYMTNAFDSPIYLLLSVIFFYYLFKFSYKFFLSIIILISSFLVFSLPFSFYFKPFVNGIGVNCSLDFLIKIGRLGPFLFEKGNCQLSPFWMLFILWGFFWVSFVIFLLIKKSINCQQLTLNHFILILFSFGTFLVLIPEFFYIKDIYPAHFRANTMFKLGYQAFIMMAISSVFVFYLISLLKKSFLKIFLNLILFFLVFFVVVYPFFSIPSYYGQLNQKVEIDGAFWLNSFYPEDKEIIDFLNQNISGQPVILEAQGDSYTDYGRISAYTGLPTVAGWLVHQWLWRGSSEVVGKRIPDIENLYQSKNLEITKNLIKKYQIKYIIVSRLEKQKYPNLNEEKFSILGKQIFKSSNGSGAIYQIN